MENIFLLTGSNLGDREKILFDAKEQISLIGSIKRSSSIYESESWGIEGQPDFLNQVLEIATDLPPEKLLLQLLEIENRLGRKRGIKYESRSIDIDILFYGSRVIQSENLTLPHPEIENRRFTLIPLAEMDPEWIHPISLKSMETLLDHCQDLGKVTKYLKP